KLKLDVSVMDVTSPKTASHFVVGNTQAGIKLIVSKLRDMDIKLSDVLFCCENTGIYTCPLSCFLSENKLDYWIVPAIEIKRSKGISRGKSDKADSKDIAYYSLRNLDKLKLSSMADKEIQQLKLLFSEREKVMKALHIFRSTKENNGFIPKEVYAAIEAINTKTIRELNKAKDSVENKIKEIIMSQEELKKQYKLIQSVPGVGPQTALYLIIATKGFKAFDNWRKLACYSGIAPFEYSSGSSIKGRAKVNDMADKKMKSLLQMGVISAIQHDPQMKEYYIKKREQGKPKMLVQNNVRCKIVSRVFSVINRQSPFINTYKFAG
ncbi:transposase, partial [Flavobacterium sp. MFBS3-15]|uniref:transposase n=1 Tax=Flavobacterium sp. MFBS3-15 TaxID=2989816 RepID=UPI0022357576